MKKISVFIVSFSVLMALSAPTLAIISPTLSYISNDQIMTSLLPKGQIDVSAKMEYWSPNEFYNDNTDLFMEPATKFISSYTAIMIPIRVSYGLMDNMSLRFSTQYMSRSTVWKNATAPYEWSGYGLGDSKIEMLYQVAKETSDKPSIAVNVGSDILTGKSNDGLSDAASDTSLATGLTAPSYYLSAIFGKTMGAWKGKALIGYVLIAPSRNWGLSSNGYINANQWQIALSMSTKASESLEYGGEISAKFAGETISDMSWITNPTFQEHSQIQRISVAPFVVYKQSEDLSWKGVLEIPLAMKGSTAQSDLMTNQWRGTSLSVGGEMQI